MAISDILASLDQEIRLLQQARALLTGASKAGGAVKGVSAAKTKGKKRRLSPEGRRRIAEAVKRRWERQRKAAASQKK